MIKRKLFKKKSINLKNHIFISLFIFSLIAFLILLFINLKQQFFIVPEYIGSFNIIPDEKGGKEVMNKDKKSLHLNDNIQDVEIINDPFLEYSIQIFSSSNYYLVKEKFDFMTNKNNNHINDLSLKIDDFFIVVFNSDLGNEYILLYKNFSTRILASDYCLMHLNFLRKCLIINAQNLN